jgi:hypothetical protein
MFIGDGSTPNVAHMKKEGKWTTYKGCVESFDFGAYKNGTEKLYVLPCKINTKTKKTSAEKYLEVTNRKTNEKTKINFDK